ncbi:DUF421 domain-containing protein [Alkalicoccus daliensis]|uniref:Uncharacterized membrane protein YcaP, DUF421 family n=1 Tax=Alkalicoccus daliensis TaxID=745820 RepID=A0A1H0L173_9BACI|nr:YetF domain-containing protein [Alkalicoccus daliensis]SDO61740.1 Uncharacterized membrane protein YcaP, DUF421 family [Alkalicoccus daliensis]
MFFDNWEGIYRTVIIAVLTYPVLILMLRASGKRTLSKMNMFDFIITIALGSTVATILLNADVSYVEGLTGLAILIFLQYIVTWFSVRSASFNKMIKGDPRLLYYKGAFIGEAMRKERMNEDEIKQAVRKNGKASFEKVEAVVLETDGSLSVIESGSGEKETVIKDLKGE